MTEDGGSASSPIEKAANAQSLPGLRVAAITLVSSVSDGSGGNGGSVPFAISFDGRYVAFESFATNLVTNDFNFVDDVFVRDGSGDIRVHDVAGAFTVASDGGGDIAYHDVAGAVSLPTKD